MKMKVRMNRFDLYKELYYKEIEQRESIANSLTLPIGIITAQVAWLYYFYNNIAFNGRNFQICATIILIVTFLLILCTIAVLILSFYRPDITNQRHDRGTKNKFWHRFRTLYAYGKMTNMAGYEAGYQVLLQNNNDESFSETQMEEALIKGFLTCIDKNSYLNRVKTAYMLKSKIFMILALTFSLILLIFTVTFPKTVKSPSEVKIITPIKLEKQ
jgi:hypothetical protein